MSDIEHLTDTALNNTATIKYNLKSFSLKTQITALTSGLSLLLFHHITHKYIRDSIR